MGVVSRIYLRPSSRTPVKQVRRTRAIAGRGLEGDHAGGGSRQVTLLSEEAWEVACDDLGRTDLEPGTRRANIVVRGVDLGETIGGGLRIGECVVKVAAETRPCRLMEDAAPGLQKALEPDRRGGVYGRILAGGEIEVGDDVFVVAPDDAALRDGQAQLPFAEGTEVE